MTDTTATTAAAAPGAGAPSPLTVRLEEFEGPLDLLLHLARTEEIDLARLPIRRITDQYLAYLESVEFRDLDDAGAVVPPADVPALAGRLRELSNDAGRRRAMGAAGRVRAQKRFSADRMSAELVQIYDELLGSGTQVTSSLPH